MHHRRPSEGLWNALYDLIRMTATQRIVDFKEQHPTLHHVMSEDHIASYLGMSRQHSFFKIGQVTPKLGALPQKLRTNSPD